MATSTTAAATNTPDRDWYIVERWQQYDAEGRANLLRMLAIGAFYAIHLLSWHGWGIGSGTSTGEGPEAEAARHFHWSITALAAGWLMIALGVMLMLLRRVFPPALPYWTTILDAVMLTAVLTVADGPSSPVQVGFFLVIVVSGLRFNLRLVWCAGASSVAGYLFLLGQARWVRPDLLPAPHAQWMTVLALTLTAVVLGQMVRRVKSMAAEYAVRRAPRTGVEP